MLALITNYPLGCDVSGLEAKEILILITDFFFLCTLNFRLLQNHKGSPGLPKDDFNNSNCIFKILLYFGQQTGQVKVPGVRMASCDTAH